MNGHTGLIGQQKENENGKMVKDWMNDFGLVLQIYLEEINDQKSVIDYALVNGQGYRLFSGMNIDEEREIFDLSDHNMITVELKIPERRNTNYKKFKVITKTFMKTDKESLHRFSAEVDARLFYDNVENISELNDVISQSAKELLQAKYRKRVDQEKRVKEPPWITKEIKKKIKERRNINRQKRNSQDTEEKRVLSNVYQKKKKEVQKLVKEAITKNEMKITAEVRSSKNKSKSLWENIDKLRKKERKATNFWLHDSAGKKLKVAEAEDALVAFWNKVYRQHENQINQVWNEETRRKYETELGNESVITLGHAWEHLDLTLKAGQTITKMDMPVIQQEEVKRCATSMKGKTAPGPDGLKSEIYKALVNDPKTLEVLTNCFQNELDNRRKPEEWKRSHTKMIPKVKKPTAVQLRPIALTNVSYKIFMNIVKEKIELHLSENDAVLDTQAGFTKGGKIEDNLFILNYCVEESYRRKKPLFVTSIDYSKAFDSVKRDKMIQALMLYKIHPKIIDVIAAIYDGDYTEVLLREVESQFGEGPDYRQQTTLSTGKGEALVRLDVTSGIRQGCTGSTTLFKIMTYIITRILQKKNLGYKNQDVHIPVLFFADDGLALTQSKEETEEIIDVITDASDSCGLNINKAKSNVIIFNSPEDVSEIKGIPVAEEIKYLGITINNKKNIFKTQKATMQQKAERMTNMTYNVICKSCNKLMIGKTYWKCLALPSILYGTRVMPLTEAEIRKLQTIENGVYRRILSAPRYAPNCTLRGEIGSSLMKSRIMEGHLQFTRDALQGRNQLLKTVIKLRAMNTRSKWTKTIKCHLDTLGLTMSALGFLKKGDLKSAVREWDYQEWLLELERKSTLFLYKKSKDEIREETVYDNTPASVILYRSRTNTLPLNDRKRHINGSTVCDICGEEEETLSHFILHCSALSETRREITILQKPYIEDEVHILSHFLFDEDSIIDNKEDLYKLWRSRERKRRSL